MHKMLRHMKKYAGMLAAIVALLVAQAMCELWLPTYTAAIVDVGIQQQGIEHSTPRAIRQSTLESLILWMPQEEAQSLVKPSYAVGTPEELEKQGIRFEDEPVWLLGKADDSRLEQLDALFDRAFLIHGVFNGQSELDAGTLMAASDAGEQAAGMTAEQLQAMVAAMDGEQRTALLKAVDERLLTVLPESTLNQAAIAAVKAEYEALGMDLRAMQQSAIWRIGAMMLLIALASAGAAVAVGYLGSRASAGLGRDLRQAVFHKVLGFGQQEMDGFSTASLITRSTNDIQQVQNVMVMLLRMVIYAPIIGVGGVIRALKTNASMAWIIAVGVAAVLGIVLVLYLLGMPRFKRMQTQVDQVNRVMRETLTGLPVIRAFCTQKREEERFDAVSRALTKTQLFVGRLMGGMMPMMMLTMNGISILIMWVGAGSIDAGTMQVGDMMAFIQYTIQIISAFLMISMMSVMLPRASVSANRIQEVLDTKLTITDPASPAAFEESARGTVEFRDVCFRYPGADEDMLSHISFTARPGETTAILGGTGSGKSTLINLIPRFYDATQGSVLVDGQDVRNVRLTDLRDRIGYVPQKGVLFSGTVSKNLTFGSTDIPRERVEQAARIAQAEDFILARDGGYDSEIAQGGTNVSGGQKQRLSIARAVAKNPEIYIFDDSFSALDFKTDAAVRSALNDAARDATVLIVAQRISTVMHAEQILVLDDGMLVGKGTHAQLMRDCEVYRQIAMSQLSKEELENGTQT
ncbi:MAG: ABC transporter ATP-binding protein/permease [Clostridiales bacterium]|nr:ABC transporter ATP-binding protein/permease [Clostridiales bacterium]